jgi:23S rRNA (cytosine1962-C5)-methyltransferase
VDIDRRLYYSGVASTGPSAEVSRRGEDRIRAGHPWIYRSDVASVGATPGDIVGVVGASGRRLGDAFFSDRSQITLRMVTLGEARFGEHGWGERIAAAAAFRESLGIDATAYRVVHGEADGLPSLIVDRYADWLVVQSLSQATHRHLPHIVEALLERFSPAGILARNDPKVRALEGLDQVVEVLHGEVPDTVEVREGSVVYEVDLRRGQKTGLFLDQRENREAAARYVHGRVLDGFSYHGGFALSLAPRSGEVLALDASADAVARIVANAARNQLSNVSAREGNVFDELRYFERDGERFDTIVLDPPAFAKNKASVDKALSGYKDINLRALRLLNPGGVLVTCSCSYNVDEPLFLQVLSEAAADARAHVTILEKRMQGRDHPVLLTVPETFYLKCVILRKM